MSVRGVAHDDEHEALEATLALFWHAVCTVEELEQAKGILPVRLLGRDLVVADLGETGIACLLDRCLHRSTRLSVGTIEGASIRCAYHGWRWGADGRCVEIPSAPEMPVPTRAWQSAYSAAVRHGLVWVRLDDRAATEIPSCPFLADPAMKVLAGAPYTWPVSALRRVENFIDLSHFAWVHAGTLGSRQRPVPPVPDVRRCEGALRFDYEPPPLEGVDPVALFGHSDYRVVMPTTVDIEFEIAGQAGVRRHLWMTASPIDSATSRTFWFMARSDRLDDDDDEDLAFQRRVLEEDEPVVCNQVPPEFPLGHGVELSVRADRVSTAYRRWIGELVAASLQGPRHLSASIKGAYPRWMQEGA